MRSIVLALSFVIPAAIPAAAQSFGAAAAVGDGEALFARPQSDTEPGALGLDPATEVHDQLKRPMPISAGQPILSLFG